MRAVRDARREWVPQDHDGEQHPGVQLHEWERAGWTYHAKGECHVKPDLIRVSSLL